MRTKTKLKGKKSKGVMYRVHPSYYNLSENIRKTYQKRGIHLSQVQISNLIAKRLKRKTKGLGLIG